MELRDTLVGQLDDRGRLQWAEEEIERLRSKDRSAPDPETLWWKLRGKTKLNGRARGVAQELTAWRDQIAKKQNRPPRTVLSDMALLALAQRPARNTEQLKRRPEPRPSALQAHRPAPVRHPARHSASKETRSAFLPRSQRTLLNVDGVIALCLAWLAQRADEEHLDMSVLGTRDDVTSLVLDQPSRLANGWRDALVGRELRSIIDGTAGLRVNGTSLELLDRVPS